MSDKLSVSMKKQLAQDLIMHHLSVVGYGTDYEEFVKNIGDDKEADKILKQQMDRIAKLFGFNEAWFS